MSIPIQNQNPFCLKLFQGIIRCDADIIEKAEAMWLSFHPAVMSRWSNHCESRSPFTRAHPIHTSNPSICGNLGSFNRTFIKVRINIDVDLFPLGLVLGPHFTNKFCVPLTMDLSYKREINGGWVVCNLPIDSTLVIRGLSNRPFCLKFSIIRTIRSGHYGWDFVEQCSNIRLSLKMPTFFGWILWAGEELDDSAFFISSSPNSFVSYSMSSFY